MMTQEHFQTLVNTYADQIEAIRLSAHQLHASVNQTYGDSLPYGFHLDLVAQGVRDFGHLVLASDDDVLPLFFGAYYHDSIEDARQTYNDVFRIAQGYLPSPAEALMATEIVYALTNDKGRTRAERAGERYYAGIRATPYAPFVKMCDRLANIFYSCSGIDGSNQRMKEVYKSEMPHFLSSLGVGHNAYDDVEVKEGIQYSIPDAIVVRVAECLIDDLEREERSVLKSIFLIDL